MDSKQDGNRRAVRRVILAFSLAILVFFEFFYLFGFLDGTCYAFCLTFYNFPCYVFSIGMFLLGLTSLVAWLPRYTWLTSAFLSAYFAVTFLASLCWARWVILLSLMALLSSSLSLGLSDWRVPTLREAAERLSFGLAFSTFLFFAVDGVFKCLDMTPEPFICILILVGALSLPLRIKRPRYSPLPLLAYFTLGGLTEGFHGLEFFGLLVSLLAFCLSLAGRLKTI